MMIVRQNRLITALLIILMMSITCSQVLATDTDYEQGAAVFKWSPTCSRELIDSLLIPIKGNLVDSLAKWPTYYFRFPDTLSVQSVVSYLQNSSCIIWAEPNYILQFATNDTFFSEQWYLKHQTSNGESFAEIQAPEAWSFGKGDREIRLAVLDSGIPYNDTTGELTHEDLKNDSGEVDFPFLLRKYENETMNDVHPLSHGTAVLGIIAARTNNSLGIAGISTGFMPLIS
jgi:hypothetical protein